MKTKLKFRAPGIKASVVLTADQSLSEQIAQELKEITRSLASLAKLIDDSEEEKDADN